MHEEPTEFPPCMGDNIPLLFFPLVNAMTSLHNPTGGVPIEAGFHGVNTVLADAAKRIEVR